MRLSKKSLKKRFENFNKLYFNSCLVEPKFVITGSKWTAGMFNCVVLVKKDDDGEEYASELKNLKIRLSKRLIRNDRILDNILLHEMIHYYGYYMNFDINGDHGEFFLSMADEINKDGYEIQQYYVD